MLVLILTYSVTRFFRHVAQHCQRSQTRWKSLSEHTHIAQGQNLSSAGAGADDAADVAGVATANADALADATDAADSVDPDEDADTDPAADTDTDGMLIQLSQFTCKKYGHVSGLDWALPGVP